MVVVWDRTDWKMMFLWNEDLAAIVRGYFPVPSVQFE